MNKFIYNFIHIGKMLLIEKNLKSICSEQSLIPSVEYRWLDSGHTNEITGLKHLSNVVVETFFSQGARCLAAYISNNLVGYVWYHYKTYRWPFFDYSIDCSTNPCVGPDFVSVGFRGKRLHGALLCLMFSELYAQGYERALGSVWTNNVSSIKGLMRVGFVPIRSIFAVRVRNILIYKRVKKIDRWPTTKRSEN